MAKASCLLHFHSVCKTQTLLAFLSEPLEGIETAHSAYIAPSKSGCLPQGYTYADWSLWVLIKCHGVSVAQVTVLTNPIWVIKTRLQLQYGGVMGSREVASGIAQKGASTLVARASQYHGLLDAMQSIAREEGIRGFYKGLFPNLILVRCRVNLSWACHSLLTCS